MVTEFRQSFAIRKSFSSIKSKLSMPNLIDIQKQSYKNFLQTDINPHKRKNIGLQAAFKSVFPIKDYNNKISLEFVSYKLTEPKYDLEECLTRGLTFAAPIKITIRSIYINNSRTNVKDNTKEQELHFGDIPLMTNYGTFMINGTERVVVSQLHRSPGVFFDNDRGKTHSSGKVLYNARIIPYRGSWIDFEFDHKDLIYCRIDRKKKFLATMLIKALNLSIDELLKYFYQIETLILNKDGSFDKSINFNLLLGQRATYDILYPDNKNIIIKKNRKITNSIIQIMKKNNIKTIKLHEKEVLELISAENIINKENNKIIVQCNEKLSKNHLNYFKQHNINNIKILYIDNLNVGPYFRNTWLADKTTSSQEAAIEIYKKLKPGDPPTIDIAEQLLNNLFFNMSKYDLSEVGRLKLNHKFSTHEPLTKCTLTKNDILQVIKYLIELKNGNGMIDDIDHLGNRRVRSVGELVENQYRIGLVRMEKIIKERISMQENDDTIILHEIINSKPIAAVIKEFFGSSQLSQFMDQTNPLSEITHKRRLSALGPGGLTRERAGFEVRDVHPTHYGRICPIETPEGQNIGLIASLSIFARVNKYGFIETPYRHVINGVITNHIKYYNALEEEKETIAQATESINYKTNKFKKKLIQVRQSHGTTLTLAENVTLMEVSTNQLVSIAAGLIPFLEHNDANRALMGSNMQRQAVPLLKTDAPIVGTGIEAFVGKDSGVCQIAKNSGIVCYVDSSKIIIQLDYTKNYTSDHNIIDVYKLTKFQRSNQDTCFNQTANVTMHDYIKQDSIIADGPAIHHGELALGQNVTVAFMAWHGYNFEDSIIVSERLVKNDIFTSIHIEEFECIARDTKLGAEEITNDIPNTAEDVLQKLDDSGIIKIGANVVPGNILVGKVTPKGETQLSPEEKLLRAIFGEKAGDIKNTSLHVPSGTGGTVINVKIFTRKGTTQDKRSINDKKNKISQYLKNKNDKIRIIKDIAKQYIKKILKNNTLTENLINNNIIIAHNGEKINERIMDTIDFDNYNNISINDINIKKQMQTFIKNTQANINNINNTYVKQIKQLNNGDDLPPGIIKIIKVCVATKRKLQAGDKMAGRHGNKGVISKIFPEEDMPYLPNGTPVDIILNPLGVPSRMNVGQILESHLGWAAKGLSEQLNLAIKNNSNINHIKTQLKNIFNNPKEHNIIDNLNETKTKNLIFNLQSGIPMKTPVFDGASEREIQQLLSQGGQDISAQTILFDGHTGEAFDKEVTVGIMYMLKLHHLVDNKIHARSIGPYSLVTQQPLGGKAQFGGQRLGEMEVWALEAYGAAYALQEFLTIKSDDIIGRNRMYEAIIKGEHILESGVPESFNVLIKELQSLGLDIQLLDKKKKPTN